MSPFAKSRAQKKVEAGDRKPVVAARVPAAFFSYSREDSEFVLQVAGDLKAAKANVWLDQMDIVPGQRWDDAVEQALAECPRMLVVLSPAAVHSTNVMDEVSFALEEGKTVVPILYRDCAIPFRLRRVQYIDFRKDYQHGLAELLKILAAQNHDIDSAAPDTSSQKEDEVDIREADPNRDRAEPVPPSTDPAGAAASQGNTPSACEASPTNQPRASRNNSAPAVPPVLRPRPVAMDDGAKSEGLSRLSMKTKAAVGACGILILATVLFWGLKPPPPKPETSRPTAVQTAPPIAAVAPAAAPSARQEPKSDSGTASLIKTAPENLTQPAQKASPQPKEGPQVHEISRKPPQPPAADTPGTSARRGGAPSDPALASLYHRAEAGDSFAMVELGMDFFYGRGMPQDYQQGVGWLRQAADAGNAKGMNNLGVMYANGNGVPKDSRQAAMWYHKAADVGYAPAMANLGSMYEKGDGVPKDSQQAIRWYQQAAQAGNSSAMYDLGAMYEAGEGVGRDRQLAVAWYSRAALLGESHAKEAIERLGINK